MDFGKIPDSSFFYLTGGTALSEFYFGHRRSYDLDLFTAEKDFIIRFFNVMQDLLLRMGYGFDVLRRFESFIELNVKKEKESVRVQLAYDSPFRFEKPHASELGVHINDYRDIVTDKLLAFFGRWTHRDAVDLFFILKNDSVDRLLQMAKQKDPGFDLYWFCAALKEVDEFPDEAAHWHVDMLMEFDAMELKKSFSNLLRSIMDKMKEQRV